MWKYIIIGIIFLLVTLGVYQLYKWDGTQIVTIEENKSFILNCYLKVENETQLEFAYLEKFILCEKDPKGNIKKHIPEYTNGAFTLRLLSKNGNLYYSDMNSVKCTINSDSIATTYLLINRQSELIASKFILIIIYGLIIIIFYNIYFSIRTCIKTNKSSN